jgi:hypothetical protein
MADDSANTRETAAVPEVRLEYASKVAACLTLNPDRAL